MYYRAIASVLGIIIAAVRYGLYARGIAKKQVKPHVFSWFVWGLVPAIVFVAQVESGAGPSAWVTAFVSVACLSFSAAAIFWGEKDIKIMDWVCFIAALFAVGLWVATKNPLLAVVVLTVADALAYVPTYRKSFYKPFEEPVDGYALATLRSVFALIALQSFALVNWLYPASLIITDGGCTLLLFIRRRQIAAKAVR